MRDVHISASAGPVRACTGHRASAWHGPCVRQWGALSLVQGARVWLARHVRVGGPAFGRGVHRRLAGARLSHGRCASCHAGPRAHSALPRAAGTAGAVGGGWGGAGGGAVAFGRSAASAADARRLPVMHGRRVVSLPHGSGAGAGSQLPGTSPASGSGLSSSRSGVPPGGRRALGGPPAAHQAARAPQDAGAPPLGRSSSLPVMARYMVNQANLANLVNQANLAGPRASAAPQRGSLASGAVGVDGSAGRRSEGRAGDGGPSNSDGGSSSDSDGGAERGATAAALPAQAPSSRPVRGLGAAPCEPATALHGCVRLTDRRSSHVPPCTRSTLPTRAPRGT